MDTFKANFYSCNCNSRIYYYIQSMQYEHVWFQPNHYRGPLEKRRIKPGYGTNWANLGQIWVQFYYSQVHT